MNTHLKLTDLNPEKIRSIVKNLFRLNIVAIEPTPTGTIQIVYNDMSKFRKDEPSVSVFDFYDNTVIDVRVVLDKRREKQTEEHAEKLLLDFVP